MKAQRFHVIQTHRSAKRRPVRQSLRAFMTQCVPVSTAGKVQATRRQLVVKAAASDSELTLPQNAALVAGAIFNPIVLFSEWTLFSTGKGLDPGPAGLYGAAEGIGTSSNWPSPR